MDEDNGEHKVGTDMICKDKVDNDEVDEERVGRPLYFQLIPSV